MVYLSVDWICFRMRASSAYDIFDIVVMFFLLVIAVLAFDTHTEISVIPALKYIYNTLLIIMYTLQLPYTCTVLNNQTVHWCQTAHMMTFKEAVILSGMPLLDNNLEILKIKQTGCINNSK